MGIPYGARCAGFRTGLGGVESSAFAAAQPAGVGVMVRVRSTDESVVVCA